MKANQTERPVIILGGGGHAAVLVDLLGVIGAEVLGVIAPEAETPAVYLPGIPYLGCDDDLTTHQPSSVCLVNGVGAVGDVSSRRDHFEWSTKLGYAFATLIHPASVIASGVTLSPGAQIMAGAVLQTAVSIGENTVVNTRASLDHHCRIGAHAFVGPGAVLSGEVTVGPEAFIGTGASVIQGITLGDRCLVGAGAAVVSDVPPGGRAGGVPARSLGAGE